MTSAGTFLEDLDKARPNGNGDSDLVEEIFQTLNEPSQSNPIFSGGTQAPPPPVGARKPMINAQQQLSNIPADPAVPTAHMIGNEHPTPADFQNMMAASGPVAFNSNGGFASQSAPSMFLNNTNNSMNGSMNDVAYVEPKKNWQGTLIDEVRQPILVAIIVFLVTLPALNLLVANYAPKLLKPTGEFTAVGMLIRACIGGALFWFFQNVVGPLVRF